MTRFLNLHIEFTNSVSFINHFFFQHNNIKWLGCLVFYCLVSIGTDTTIRIC